MKRYLLTILLLLCAAPAWAWNFPIIASMQSGEGESSNTCTTADDSLLVQLVSSIDDATGNFSPESDRRAYAQSFEVSCTGTFMLTEIVTACSRVNNASNAYVSVYTDSSSAPGSEVSGTSVEVAWSTIGSSKQLCSFPLATPKAGLSCNTTYWVFFFTTGTEPDGKFYVDTTGAYADGSVAEDLSYPSSWDTTTRAAMDMYVDVYGCQE